MTFLCWPAVVAEIVAHHNGHLCMCADVQVIHGKSHFKTTHGKVRASRPCPLPVAAVHV